LIDLLIYLFTY